MDYYGKVYEIVCNDGYYYIGSTKNDLRKRLYEHKQHAKQYPQRKCYKHMLDIGWDNIKIVLIEDVICNNRQELVKKEYEHIKKHKDDKYCLNIISSSHDKASYDIKYREDNHDKLIAYEKQYREDHVETIKEYRDNYRVNNRAKFREYQKAYRQRKKEELKELISSA